jgi:hypothetical protein
MAIKDSGSRTEFKSGAVRDIQKGKGRCDLLPLDVVSKLFVATEDRRRDIFEYIFNFCESGKVDHLNAALCVFCELREWDLSTMLLEVSVHFEEGAEKYSTDNWKKGINAKNYINSGVRHLLKWLRGDEDERHDRAFVWNLMCCVWTCMHIPELNDYRKDECLF